jgi:hypothetical protein
MKEMTFLFFASLKSGTLGEKMTCKLFSKWSSVINLERYSFFKNVILENEVSHIYVEPNIVANCMASVLKFMYLS